MAFKTGYRNWTDYRKLPGLLEIDFHFSGQEITTSYYERMDDVWHMALNAIIKAQKEGKDHVLFTHGCSTSRNGATTSRSQIRKLMRSKIATPFILRSQCIQHETVFVVVIRPLKFDA